MLVQPNGYIVLTGAFTSYGGTPQSRITRVDSTGILDSGFATNLGGGADNKIYASALQTDGKIVVGGTFTKIDGTPRSGFARINTDGFLDGSFIIGAGANGGVMAIAVQGDGKIIIGGDFTQYNGLPSPYVARIYP